MTFLSLNSLFSKVRIIKPILENYVKIKRYLCKLLSTVLAHSKGSLCLAFILSPWGFILYSWKWKQWTILKKIAMWTILIADFLILYRWIPHLFLQLNLLPKTQADLSICLTQQLTLNLVYPKFLISYSFAVFQTCISPSLSIPWVVPLFILGSQWKTWVILNFSFSDTQCIIHQAIIISYLV